MDVDEADSPPQVFRRRAPRRRVDKACDTCRRRKERCNGAKPQCSTCRIASRECLYSKESRKRGLPEGWVRCLEKTWALAFICVPGLESALVTTISKGLRNGGSSDFASIWTDNSDTEGLSKRWKASLLHSELEQLLPQLESLPTPQIKDSQPGVSQRLASTFDLFPRSIDSASLSEQERSPDQPVAPYPTATADTGLPQDAADLIELYVSCTQNWLPIVETHHLYRVYYRWSQCVDTPSDEDQACLLSILALAQLQSSCRSGTSTACQNARALLSRTRALFPESDTDLKIGHLQALLMMALCQAGWGKIYDAWLLIGRAARATLLLQSLSKEASSIAQTTENSTGRLQHVVLACFVLDTLFSAKLKLPPTLQSVELGSLHSVHEDGPEEWAPGTYLPKSTNQSGAPRVRLGFTLSTFNRLVEVCRCLNAVHAELRWPSTQHTTLTDLRATLKSWDSGQPLALRFDVATTQDGREALLPQHFTLYLAYLVALLATHLRFEHAESTSYQLSEDELFLTQQISSLVSFYENTFDARSIPIIWEPLFGILCEFMETVLGTGATGQALQRDATPVFQLMSSAANVWPAFQDLKSRYSLISSGYESNSVPGIAIPLIPLSIFNSAAANLPPGSAINDGMQPSEPTQAVEFAGSHDQNGSMLGGITLPPFSPTTHATAVDSGQLDVLTTSDSSFQDLVTMDALNW